MTQVLNQDTPIRLAHCFRYNNREMERLDLRSSWKDLDRRLSCNGSVEQEWKYWMRGTLCVVRMMSREQEVVTEDRWKEHLPYSDEQQQWHPTLPSWLTDWTVLKKDSVSTIESAGGKTNPTRTASQFLGERANLRQGYGTIRPFWIYQNRW